jgi:hypothetical protein
MALEIASDWSAAAGKWRALGCPYEAALALGEADDQDALRQAFDELRAFGAKPAEAIVVRRLRESGGGLPRGPRPETRENPANLTPREVEGLSWWRRAFETPRSQNASSSHRRPVDRHVSAILRKLDVRTRGEACAQAVRLGLAAQDR